MIAELKAKAFWPELWVMQYHVITLVAWEHLCLGCHPEEHLLDHLTAASVCRLLLYLLLSLCMATRPTASLLRMLRPAWILHTLTVFSMENAEPVCHVGYGEQVR